MTETDIHLDLPGTDGKIPLRCCGVLVLGSGAAGLAAAVQLRRHGVEDVLVLTEGLEGGTSINTGSDKQTYYKLSLCGGEADSPVQMAQAYVRAGGCDGELALIESALSVQGFMHLVQLGVQFPRDRYGQFVGYRTDHDPRRRATSVGPYTSRDMCRALLAEARGMEIPIVEDRCAVELCTVDNAGSRAVAGVLALDEKRGLEAYACAACIFAVGGPGGLYADSVYPGCHTGAIGLALRAGARARNLPESQFGLASTAVRWNVSGSYMQVVPRVISCLPDGTDEREFLRPSFDRPAAMHSAVFRKGYEWPFHCSKTMRSSLIDLFVLRETQAGRRVLLDFRTNPDGFSLADLDADARDYLRQCGATQASPVERLEKMNPQALAFYRERGIDLAREPMQIALCAQHNNGGLAADLWWQSPDIDGLYPVGEVNGSHGVARPGGSALNAGQVGAIRAAQHIEAFGAADAPAPGGKEALAKAAVGLLKTRAAPKADWREQRHELQRRMSDSAGALRDPARLQAACDQADRQWQRLRQDGWGSDDPRDSIEILRNRQLCFAHRAYLHAIRFAVESGVGSRGGALVIAEAGEPIHSDLPPAWRAVPEDAAFRDTWLETRIEGDTISHAWRPCRPIPTGMPWFETAWGDYLSGRIYHRGNDTAPEDG